MARQPFYGRGPGPQIARMDMNAATAPGRLYGQMFANLGKIAGDSIEKYAEGKKKKEEQKQTASFIKRALINSPEIAAQFGIQGDDSMTFEEAVDQGSNAIAKDPKGFEMVKGFAAMADQQRKAQQDTELFNRKISQFDRSQETADELKEKTAGFDEFLSEQPQVIDPTGPGRFDVLRNLREGKGVTPPARMIPGASPAEEMLMSPEAKSFARRAVEGGQPMSLVMPMAQKIDSQIAAQTPKPMTPIQEAELKKINLANRKAEIEVSDLETPKADYKAGPTIVEDNIFRALDIIKESPKTTTGMGSYLSNIPGTDAKSLKERLGSIKANIGFDYLQAMREASPTGGALGNVSDKELQGLQSVFGSLEQSLDAEELTYNLNLLNYTYNNVIHGEGNHNVLDPRKGGNSPQQSANTIDPADLENAIQAKRKLLEQRTMMQQTLDNPNVPNYGSQ